MKKKGSDYYYERLLAALRPLSIDRLNEVELWAKYKSGRDIGIEMGTKKLIAEPITVRVEIGRPSFSVNSATETFVPPGIGEALIVMFAPKNRVDAVLGDLAERFAEEAATKGKKRASLLFWTRVLRSIGPLLWVKIRNGGFLAVLLEIGRRWIGS